MRCSQLRGSALGIEALIRKAFSEVDPNLTIINVQSMQEQVEADFDQQRAVAQMTGLFGALALVLAAVGLYGVTAYTVERRTSEIGVRMALGANRSNVVRLVLRGAFRQVLIGLIIGIPISIACGRLIAAQLYQVKSWDPLVLAGSIAAWDSVPSSPASSPPSAPPPSIRWKLCARNKFYLYLIRQIPMHLLLFPKRVRRAGILENLTILIKQRT